MNNTDEVFLNENGILITRTRFVSGAKTFALANISSVRGVEIPPNQFGRNCLTAIGLTLGVIGFAFIIVISDLVSGWGLILLGMALVASGIMLMRRQKPSFAIMLTTSGGEMEAYSSQDRDFMDRVINAANQAIISRG